MLAGSLDGLPGPPRRRATAARLRGCGAALQPGRPRAPRPLQLAALNAALVLLADHELAASTLAARVAASAWADPYRVVLAGLGPLGGALHGGASLAVEALLNAATPVVPSPRSSVRSRPARRPASDTACTGTRIRAPWFCSSARRPWPTPARRC